MRTILAFGDSNTHGTMPMAGFADRARYARPKRWPDVLAAELGAGFEVIAEGHPGRSTVHDDPIEGGHKAGIGVLKVLLETHRPLDLVIVMLGTNDLKVRFSLTPEDVALGVGRLLQEIAASDCGPGGAAPRALAVAPVPIVETGFLARMYAGGAAKSQALAGEIAAVAGRCGAGFWDAGTVGEVDPDEGIHLTEAAHGAIGRALAGEVRGLLP